MTAPILYVRDGSRFVPLPDVLLRDVPPIPEPIPVSDEPSDRYYKVPAPKCQHGSYLRWALGRNPKTGAPNCPPCHQEARRAR